MGYNQGYTPVSPSIYKHHHPPYKQGVAGATSAFGSRGPFGLEPGMAHHVRKPLIPLEWGTCCLWGTEVRVGALTRGWLGYGAPIGAHCDGWKPLVTHQLGYTRDV